jgi:hypothetical protein
MGENSIATTPGAGKNVHTNDRTISAVLIQDQFMLPGEFPYGSYTVTAPAISAATLNDHMLEIMAGASLNVRIRRIIITQNAAAAAVGGLALRLFRLTTAGTGGGAVTPSKLDNADGAAGATAMTLPTAKGTEAVQVWGESLYAATGAIPMTRNRFEWLQVPNSKPIIIPAGTANGLAIKNATAVATATWDITVEFVETNFV